MYIFALKHTLALNIYIYILFIYQPIVVLGIHLELHL